MKYKAHFKCLGIANNNVTFNDKHRDYKNTRRNSAVLIMQNSSILQIEGGGW